MDEEFKKHMKIIEDAFNDDPDFADGIIGHIDNAEQIVRAGNFTASDKRLILSALQQAKDIVLGSARQ